MHHDALTATGCLPVPADPPAFSAARAEPEPDKLRRYLQAYWLRPENALWMTLRSDALDRTSLDAPAIDVACGDGIYTFLHLGGRLHPDFDVFTAVGGLDRVRDQHADMFDVTSESYAPTIASEASTRVELGMDLKPNLLNKAARLGLYRRMIQHDANAPLPLPTDSVRTVYCNAAYWIRNINGFLTELTRITQPRGRIILQVKLDTMRTATLESYRDLLGERFLDIVGRGRIETWPTLASRSEWEHRFERAGLDIVDVLPLVTSIHAQLWDVGLRPLAPLLVRMVNHLDAATRSSIKRDWVDLFMELLSPLRRFDLTGAREPAVAVELQYLLTPR